MTDRTIPDTILVTFKADSLTTVSRATLRALAAKLGMSETDAIHLALANLSAAVNGPEEEISPGQPKEAFPELSDETTQKIHDAGAAQVSRMREESPIVRSESLL